MLGSAKPGAKQTLPQKGGMWTSADNNVLELPLPLSSSSSCSHLIVEVWNSNLMLDSLIGKTVLDLSPVLLNPSEY
jgi:hypothetical protein